MTSTNTPVNIEIREQVRRRYAELGAASHEWERLLRRIGRG